MILAVVCCAAISGGVCPVGAADAAASQTYCPPGYINVVACGATADDDVDDTRAFTMAISTGMPVYVPKGEFFVSQTLAVSSGMLVGAGPDQSRITARLASDKDAILSLGSSFCSLRDITVGYDASLLTGEEGEGERVAVLTGAVWALQTGSSLRNVRFENVGTAIYSLFGDQYASFSVTFEDLVIRDFTFRGMDFRGDIRTGNYFRNIYMTTKYAADSALYMEGEESETTFGGLVLENMKVREALHLRGLKALRMTGVSLNNVAISEENGAFILLDNTNGVIDAVTVKNGTVTDNSALFKMAAGAYYINHGQGNNASFVTVKALQLDNLHDQSLTGKPFHFAQRENGAAGIYDLKIVNYLYKTDHADEAEYERFSKSGGGIALTVRGETI